MTRKEEVIKALEQEPCEDCISRQAVLDAFADYVGSGMSMDDFNALWDIVVKIQPVKPQEPKTEWISVSERLPEEYCLFCDADGNIFYGFIRKGIWWSFDDTVEDVVAWMPLPEPYKESEEKE